MNCEYVSITTVFCTWGKPFFNFSSDALKGQETFKIPESCLTSGPIPEIYKYSRQPILKSLFPIQISLLCHLSYVF